MYLYYYRHILQMHVFGLIYHFPPFLVILNLNLLFGMLAFLLIAVGIGVGYACFKGQRTRIWVQDLMFRAQKGLGSVGNMGIDYTWIISPYSLLMTRKSISGEELAVVPQPPSVQEPGLRV